MLRSARDRFTEYCKYYPRTGRTLLRHMEEIRDPGKLMDQIIENIPADYTVKQKILEQVDLESRFEALAEVLATEVEVARIRTDLTEKVRERVDKNQKDYILREQLKYIQEELGEDDASDAALYEEKLQQLKASKDLQIQTAFHKQCRVRCGTCLHRDTSGASVGQNLPRNLRPDSRGGDS